MRDVVRTTSVERTRAFPAVAGRLIKAINELVSGSQGIQYPTRIVFSFLNGPGVVNLMFHDYLSSHDLDHVV